MPGPLVVHWLGCELPGVRAGATTEAIVELENAGSASWQRDVNLSYHWLDELGNPIVWDGVRTPLGRVVEPGQRLRSALQVRGPIPPGHYRLAVDLVDEGRLWFAEVGNSALEVEQDVGPRIDRALAVRGGDAEALAAQEEPPVAEDAAAAIAFLAEGCAPAPDWSRRVLDAHQEGYALVGGAIDAGGLLGRRPSELAPWEPGRGRLPRFDHPLLCPSVVRGVEPDWQEPVAGLPAARAPDGEPWLYDGRIEIRARLRSGRPRG
jgi:hypothetical protein